IGGVLRPATVRCESAHVIAREGLVVARLRVHVVVPVLLGAGGGARDDGGTGEQDRQHEAGEVPHRPPNTAPRHRLRQRKPPSSITCIVPSTPSGNPSTNREGCPRTMPVARS